jgi:ribosomal protein S12 methylthiotransferase accessory factor
MTDTKRAAALPMVHYELEHMRTEAGTGWFAPMPAVPVDFEVGLEYLRDHPNDEFLHRYMLNLTGSFGPNLTAQLIERGLAEESHLAALMYEACLLSERLGPLLGKFQGQDLRALVDYSPLIYIRWTLNRPPQDTTPWLSVFSHNILEHKPLPSPDALEFPVPFDRQAIERWERNTVPIEQLVARMMPGTLRSLETARPDPKETADKAAERIEAAGLQTSSENLNPASFSPYALQIKWHMETCVCTGRHRFRLTGIQTSYGKGLTEQEARASCLMEVVERVSSFAGFESDGTTGYKHGYTLIHARLGDLRQESLDALDPNDMHLEVAYENQPLYWLSAERVDEQGAHPLYIPAQLVFLFCNLDETCLSDGMPSTGLASGNTLEEAKLNALLEVLERDAERIMPYRGERCFVADSDLPSVRRILDRARGEGIQIRFLDITTELGVPCYQAFIEGPNGQILKGCAAHLDGKRAAVSALLEVPFHASWFRAQPEPIHGRTVKIEGLPNYATGDAGRDLRLLERLLNYNGYRPIYVNLTREDLDIPVVKALVPGLEFFAEFDRFSPLSARQFAHYLAAFP